jgi:phage baseplate assembly protein W
MTTSAGFGIDRRTGKPLSGWPHVLQSIEVIFTTRIGERVELRFFGAAAPILLGRVMTPATILAFWQALRLALETWEPRFHVTRFIPGRPSAEQARGGHFSFQIEGEYRPRAHLGDPTPEGTLRRLSVGPGETGINVRPT